ncbi:Flp pilus assembly CpaF family ATPase [Promicromonospora sp. AC04]|uniref:CpaF family protein n=1 Tax=Promicromonospora sp. AC04 TaxID=2135723 RepID=UPI000D338370|nr:CpaF/VirB11 family protein [Promicromonospora sp. AC04]PUB20852.1 Flp pilus assembly CpaF family ATPase [Promicromonospora sp. AC04]
MTAEPRTSPQGAADPAALPLFTRQVPSGLPPNLRRPANPWVGAGHPDADGTDRTFSPGASAAHGHNGRAIDRSFEVPRSAPVGAPNDWWTLVDDLRKQVSDEQAESFAPGTDGLVREAAGEAAINRLVKQASTDRHNDGKGEFTVAVRAALKEAVFNSLFRMGRLQPLLDNDQVENVEIYGHGDVQLQLADGSWVPGPPVAESDQELINLVQDIASRSESGARPFSERNPFLDIRLPRSGARLAASAWVTDRPVVVIRRHRLVQVTLDRLVELKMLSPVAASFLAAAVRARKSIVVSGAANAGKTTLARALCDQIPQTERIATFETEYELGLQDLRPNVIAWEARPGSGEVSPDGKQAGESTISEALWRSFRYNRSRLIVGEVRGAEVWPMIKAMESGTGSLSTTHATSAIAAIRKLVTCAMEGEVQVTQELATSKLAHAIDLIVHIDLSYDHDSQARRQVAEIIAVTPGERETGYAATQIFGPGPGGAAVATIMPDLEYQQLDGFDLQGFAEELNPAAARPRAGVRS